ncbi:MAG: hypothetical protein ABR863_06980 [Roseiarcus sp.]
MIATFIAIVDYLQIDLERRPSPSGGAPAVAGLFVDPKPKVQCAPSERAADPQSNLAVRAKRLIKPLYQFAGRDKLI